MTRTSFQVRADFQLFMKKNGLSPLTFRANYERLISDFRNYLASEPDVPSLTNLQLLMKVNKLASTTKGVKKGKDLLNIQQVSMIYSQKKITKLLLFYFCHRLALNLLPLTETRLVTYFIVANHCTASSLLADLPFSRFLR